MPKDKNSMNILKPIFHGLGKKYPTLHKPRHIVHKIFFVKNKDKRNDEKLLPLGCITIVVCKKKPQDLDTH